MRKPTDLGRRGIAMLVAFCGCIMSQTKGVDWASIQFWAGVVVLVVPAYFNPSNFLKK